MMPMLRLICALFLLIATAQYVGPVSPGLARCVGEHESDCEDTNCRDQCSLCVCTLDRPIAIGAEPVGPPLALTTARLRPVPQDVPPSPPAAEILHVPRRTA